MKYIVNKHEIGLLLKNDSYVKMLPSGSYWYRPFSRFHVISADMRYQFPPPGLDLALFTGDRKLMEQLHLVMVKDHEIVLHYADGIFVDVLPPGRHAYFKTIHEHTFVPVDTNNPIVAAGIDPAIFRKEWFCKEGAAYVTSCAIPAGSVGVLTINGDYVKTLPAGNHYFWKGRDNVDVRQVDLRTRLIDITGQELLSQDKVTLRMNFICRCQVTDAVKVATAFDHHQEQLYSTLQLALREYVATKKLDELLAEKHEIGRIICAVISQKQDDLGVVFLEAGVKDIILPGDVRDILNTVLVAEKKALANVITRREETASTRSLLNTARLMEENQTLFKLKELEYLEHICDKVGSISLSSGAGIIEQLGTLLGKASKSEG